MKTYGVMNSGETVECWACGRLNFLPQWGGIAVPIIRCHWCSALIEEDPIPTDSINTNHLSLGGRRDTGNHSTKSTSQKLLGVLTATLVLAQVFFLAWTGIWVLLPEIMHNSLMGVFLPAAQLLAALLTASIFFSYTELILRHPGPIAEHVGSILESPETIPQNALYDFRWCEVCLFAKPPNAHHCSRCAICVQNLDHHCIYTANRCVGDGNMAAFMRFLTLVLAGTGWAALACIVIGWHNRSSLVAHTLRTWQTKVPLGFVGSLMSFSIRWVLTAPRTLGVWSVSFVISLCAVIGVGFLLARQLRMRSKGMTFLEEMRTAKMGSLEPENGMDPGIDGLKMKGM